LYPLFVSATDSDGNALDGLLDPLLALPIATLTGWLLRADGYSEGDLYSINGAVFHFAKTREERARNGDPRLSLQERYGSLDGWIDALRATANAQVTRRLMLEEDIEWLISRARLGWSINHFTG
jgi:Alpha/beta hydrolase domain